MLTCINRYVLCFTLVLLALVCEGFPAAASGSVAYQKVKVAGVWMDLVTIDLNNPSISVTPAISQWGIGSCESFRSMMRRTRPAAAIDGTFFCTRSLRPTGDIVIGGQLVYKGFLGVALGIRANRHITFMPSRHSSLYRWSDYDDVLVAGPTLISGGRVTVVPKAEGFRSGVHFSKRTRAAVGLTSANKLLMAATTGPVYLSQFAQALKALKCVEAAGLDGGSSTGLYWNGKLIRNPSRGMTNCLLVYDDPYAYEKRRSALCPTSRPVSAQSDRGGGIQQGGITLQL